MSKHKRDVLMPVVATIASAVANYLAKKGPQYLEQAVMPKLRETTKSTGDVAQDLVERARSAVSDDGDPPKADDLGRRRRERAEHRAARRKAS